MEKATISQLKNRLSAYLRKVRAGEQDPSTLGFVCLDERLTVAAQREGFDVAP